MLIQALCDYYDELAKDGRVVPEGYSEQAVHYLIALTEEGNIGGIIDYRVKAQYEAKGGKLKERFDPRIITLPQRTEKPGIDSNFVEHRPLYIFGLNYENGSFSPDDKTGKARKSHEAFVQKNLEYTEGLNSPMINAYRNFIIGWIPENETDNSFLTSLGKEYKNSYFAFCLYEDNSVLLHKDKLINERVTELFSNQADEDVHYSECAVTGESLPIARIHGKIKGVAGGLASGTVLIGYKTSAGCSYCNEQSYNSNVSELAMKKYTFALNYLLADRKHKTVIDDVTVVYWATGGEKTEQYSDIFDLFFNDNGGEPDDKMDRAQTEKMLKDTFELAKSSELTKERLTALAEIDDSIDFYIVGLKPNASRVAVKFIYRRKFADILFNIAKHQADMTIIGRDRRIPLWRLKKELVSPKSTDQNVDPSLLSAIFKSIIYDSPYPVYLLSTLVTRVKTDRDINDVRAGTIKACINRKSRAANEKEELQVALDISNTNQAYLCGRLFAVLERIQKQALGDVNRSIKDAYFASAASKPSLVFPKLISLSQNHMKKLDEGKNVYYNKLIEEIIDKLDGQFPDTLSLTDQGKFMIGYYHQDKDFYTKKNKEDK